MQVPTVARGSDLVQSGTTETSIGGGNKEACAGSTTTYSQRLASQDSVIDHLRIHRTISREFSMRKQLLALMVCSSAVACGGGGDGGGGGPNPSPNVIAKTASDNGDNQAGTVGSPLALPFCVRVSKDGASQPDVNITWSTVGGSMNPTTDPTKFDGSSCSTLTLAQAAGAYTAQAALAGATGSPIIFHATANPGAPTQLQEAIGEGASGEVNSEINIAARVTDAFGNGIQNIAVAYAVTAGAATVSPSSTGSLAGTGNAPVTVTLGPVAGPVVVTATSPGLTGSPRDFHLTAVLTPPPPTAITINVNNNNFSPSVDTVAVGGTVTWNWVGNGHTVTSTGPTSFVSDPAGVSNNGHQYGPLTFNTAGTYFYYCEIHGAPGNPPTGMSGRIVVK
jgi:plastocyanin